MSRNESVTDLTKILKEEDSELEDKKEKENELEVEAPGREEEDEIEEEIEEEGEELEEEGKGKEKEKELIQIPQFKEITKKYPKLFDDFPNLRHIFFHEKNYRELFPTVEEAKEAVEELEDSRFIRSSLESGEEKDIANVLNAINDISDEALPSLSMNFLPLIRKIDQNLYYKVITPELVNFTRVMFDAGLRNENDNLKNAALVAALHFFGDQKVATGEKEIKLPSSSAKSGTEEEKRLEKERQQFRQERYTTFYNDVISSADSSLSKAILNGLDPKEEMTDAIKEMASEKIMREITKTLSADPSHTNKMDSLWRRASKENFVGSWKNKIINAYLESAKEIMPRIRAKVRAGVLGIRERQSELTGGERRKRIEPESTTGGGQSRNSNFNKNLNSKDIDWKKTSDLDLIRGNVTLKKS